MTDDPDAIFLADEREAIEQEGRGEMPKEVRRNVATGELIEPKTTEVRR